MSRSCSPLQISMNCKNPVTAFPSPPKCLHVAVLEPLHQVSLLTLRYHSLYATLQATNLPAEQFTGYLSLTILELNIYTLFQRGRLFCTEWSVVTLPIILTALKLVIYSCGVPLFANTTTTKCKQCETVIPLRINPRLVRSLQPSSPRSPLHQSLVTPWH